ncbi:MAG: hypothetical protein U0I30_00160 [Flavonifractor plautii]|jgi:hypothetical protein|nr:hypothetical protein [Flavonifractor plautii]
MKRFTAIILALTLLLSMVPASAVSNKEPLSADDYQEYTITFDSSLQTRATGTTVDDAIEFVNSLDLESLGYSYIEEACLLELNEYKEAGDVELESYTVLVPKAGSAKHYFGTVGVHNFYYDLTSKASLRSDVDGTPAKSENDPNWTGWIAGILNLVMCIDAIPLYVSLPYTAIANILTVNGIDSRVVHEDAFLHYTTQYEDIETRSIYREDGTEYKLCFVDQEGNMQIKVYYCPVGISEASDYIYLETVLDEQEMKSHSFTEEEVLSMANVQASHNSKVSFVLAEKELRIIEQWE